jgi:uncharacterized membrane protein
MQTRFPRLAAFAAWGLVALGVVLRLRQYLANRSLWLDEAMLALNIVGRDFAGLLKPLDYDQGAPLGFLLLEKLAATLFGDGELPLRLLPLLAGCASLVLFYFVLRRILNPAGTLAALALFAISPTLVYYSSEAKQYSFDVFVTLVLLWLAIKFFNREGHEGIPWPDRQDRQRKIFFGVIGALALWFSHPALFVLAAIGIVLLIRNRKNPLPALAMGGVWLVSLSLLYLVNLRGLSANDFLLGYWRAYFMPLPPNFFWLKDAFLGLFENPAGLTGFAPVLFVVALIGMFWLFKRGWQNILLLLLPFAFTLVASALGKYPFAGRMMLFAVPLVYIFLAAVVDWLSNLSLHPRFLSPLFALALAGYLLYPSALDSAGKFVSPKYPEHIRPAMAYLREFYKPGDVIYVYGWALPAWRYYAPRYGFDPEIIVPGTASPEEPVQLLAEVDALRGNPRVWFLFTHVYESGGLNDMDYMLAHLDAIGNPRRKFVEPGTSVYLYLYDLQ